MLMICPALSGLLVIVIRRCARCTSSGKNITELFFSRCERLSEAGVKSIFKGTFSPLFWTIPPAFFKPCTTLHAPYVMTSVHCLIGC